MVRVSECLFNGLGDIVEGDNAQVSSLAESSQ